MHPCPKTMASKKFIITWGVLFILMFPFASKVASTTELDNPCNSIYPYSLFLFLACFVILLSFD